MVVMSKCILAAAIVVAVILGRGESITLAANEDLTAYTLRGSELVKASVIPKGTVHQATGCTDRKSFIGVDVTIDGMPVVVVDGDFRLDRRPFLYAWRLPVVWSCP
jgi:hypothetical protein